MDAEFVTQRDEDCFLVFGNEVQGLNHITETLVEAETLNRIYIPMSDKIRSYNLANRYDQHSCRLVSVL